MLKKIPTAISPELMKILMEMGHGGEIMISDGKDVYKRQAMTRFSGWMARKTNMWKRLAP